MRMASKKVTPCYCIQHSRFTKKDGWRLWDLSLSLNGNIAVTGGNENTHRTFIDVYTNYSDSRDKTKIIYSKEFEKYVSCGMEYGGRSVSFYPGSDTMILSGLGDKLEAVDFIQDRVTKSRKIKLVNNGGITCQSVRETEIFICFYQSNKITVYDVIDLNEIKSIILQGIQDGYWSYDMTAVADRIVVCVGVDKEDSNYKSLIFEEKNGRILSELTKPTDTVQWYVNSLGVNMNMLAIAAVVWFNSFYKRDGERWQIVFYSLLSENNCSFLIVEVEFGVKRIRISDRGDRMITAKHWTGEVKVYDMIKGICGQLGMIHNTKQAQIFKISNSKRGNLNAELFTYSHFKEKLASTLQTNECTKLAHFFKMPKDQIDAILSSDKPSEHLLALEAKSILEPHNVDRLIEAFDELRANSFCRHVADIFRKTRSPSYYKEALKKMKDEMKTLQMASEEKGKELKEKTTEVEDLLKELTKLQEAHLKITQERDKFKTERDEGQLQQSSLQEELKASKKAKAETETVLKQTEELLQKIIQEKNEIEPELKQMKVEHSLGLMSLQKGRKNQAESGKKRFRDAKAGEISMPSPDQSKYLPESALEDEFCKVIVKVSTRLTRTSCVYLARYFNFSPAKAATIQEESKTPGLDLLDAMKERNIINMYDVTELQKALVDLQLKEINETLVSPYHKKIDPRVHERHKVLHKEK